MTAFTARRIRFANGERHSVLSGANGVPVHEVTLFLVGRPRKRGLAANTIHAICTALGVLYKALARAEIDLLDRLRRGKFLNAVELDRIVTAVQLRADEFEPEPASKSKSVVVSVHRVRRRTFSDDETPTPIDTGSFATRLRYIAFFLEFLVDYFKVDLTPDLRTSLERDAQDGLNKLKANIPRVTKRAALGARQGLSKEEADRLMDVVRPGSPNNPWKRGFVQRRNWVIVMVLLATGMRRGELLGMQVGDLQVQKPFLQIIRRADSPQDPRVHQEGPKTREREVELIPALMKSVWDYVDERKKIRPARKHPLLIVTEEGDPMSSSQITKIFREIRDACPGLPVRLTSHVLRHSWNDRFSEEADRLGLNEAEEQRARNEQQGWSPNSKTAATYTRRHASRVGREMSVKLQEDIDAKSR